MPSINISDIKYYAELLTESGKAYPLDNALISLSWEEQISELAQKATLTVANVKVGDVWLIALAKLNCIVKIYAKWGTESKTQVFEGNIWEWDYKSAQQKELVLTVYDGLIRLQQSKDHFYFKKGMTTKQIITKICSEWGVPLSYVWAQGITHEKKAFSADTISDMIIGLLEEVKQKKGEKYVVLWRNSKLEISGYGTNKDIYKFTGTNTTSTGDKLSLSNLVTRVKILGKADKEGRASVDHVMNGDTQYGVLQEIVRRDSDKTLAKAKEEAAALIKTRGKPAETITVQTAGDLPFLRKGDKIEIEAGNLLGFFWVEGVTHTAISKEMSLTLTRADVL